MITIIFSSNNQPQHRLASPGGGFRTWLVSLVKFSQGQGTDRHKQMDCLNLLPCPAWNSGSNQKRAA